MPQTFFYGKAADYGVNGTTYRGNKGWTITPAVEDLRTDNTADNGFSNRIAGIHNAPFTIEADWDASQNPLDAPPNLQEGTVLSAVQLFLDSVAASPYWLFPSALVLNVPVSNMVDGVCHYTVNAANKGRFYRPSGNFAPSAPAGEVYGYP